MNQPTVLYTLVASIVGSILLMSGVIYTAVRKGRSDDATLKVQQATKIEESAAAVRIAALADRDTWEQRVIGRLVSLEEKSDKELEKRHALEEDLHKNKLRIAELESQVRKLQSEKVAASKNYEDKIIEQDKIIHDLQTEIKELHKRCEELTALCQKLQKELDTERHIGATEAQARKEGKP